MKKMQRPCAALVLTLMLALPSLAGDMATGPGATPPPPMSTTSVTPQGQMDTGSGANNETDSLAEAALGLMQSLLALF